MRSPAEIAFRLRQEIANAALFWRPPAPTLPAPATPFPALAGLHPEPDRAQLRALVEQILDGRIPALGLTLETGREIHWRRDYLSGRETPPAYFRRIPYLDPQQAGDHKVVWEINRHQHLVALALEATQPDPHPGAAPELFRQLESWLDANPFQRGINWTSALEVAFRALSWIWIEHYAAALFPAPLHRRFLTALYRHGLHLQYNLSVYFSPNTHLLGEALALYALGVLFPAWPRAADWAALGSRWVLSEMDRQVRADGSHFEQSAYYHVYAADMFLFYARLAKPGAAFDQRLAAMTAYLDHLLGPSRLLPMFGDDDGGRLFYPYGDRTRWAAETAQACAAYLGRFAPLGSRLFADAGLAVMIEGDLQVIADGGPFGPGSAGHSHSDTLSLLVRRGREQLLIDPATYTYVGDPVWRDRFRGSAAHNTVRIDGRDQASPAGPFAWRQPLPQVEVRRFDTDVFEAACRYAGFEHVRRLRWSGGRLTVEDTLNGPPGEHLVEWFWHPGEPCERTGPAAVRIGSAVVLHWDESLSAELSEQGEYGWRSPALGVKQPSPVLRLSYRGPLPVERRAVLDLATQT